MRKPRPQSRPARPEAFVQVTELRLPMTLILSFDRSVSMLRAKETARKLMDGIRVEFAEPPEEMGEASIRCPALQRSIRVP